jgi:tetratricopeptide (TPR) repeat protein
MNRRDDRRMILVVIVVGLLLTSGFEACRDSGSTPRLDPLQEKAQEHYLKGRRLFLTCDPNNYPLAIQEFQQALAYWDEYPEALAAFAETYSMWRGFFITDEEFGEAYRSAQRALRLNPELAAGYRAVADLFRHKGEYERALRQIETAIRLEPDNAENYYVKGSSLLSQDSKQSVQVLSKAVLLNPDLPKTYYNLAAAYHANGDSDNAVKSMQRYQELVPNDPSGNTSLGIIYRDMGKIEDALAQFQKAVAQPYSTLPWEKQWLHLAYLQLGQLQYEHYQDYSSALEFLLKADQTIPDNLEAEYYLGLTYAKLRNNKQASRHLQKALEINPDFAPARDALNKLR